MLHNPELDKVPEVYEAIKSVRTRRHTVSRFDPPDKSVKPHKCEGMLCLCNSWAAAIIMCSQLVDETGLGAAYGAAHT